jgi:hypothetical protein
MLGVTNVSSLLQLASAKAKAASVMMQHRNRFIFFRIFFLF